jgi:hypothetical protein
MKRIASVLLLLAVAINISGCASTWSLWSSKPEVKPLEIITKPVEKTPLSLNTPEPLKLPEIRWHIVTKDNVDQVLRDIEANGEDPVLFALTDNGYKDLSIMFSEIRNFISNQQVIIIKYKEYYEPIAPQEEPTKK